MKTSLVDSPKPASRKNLALDFPTGWLSERRHPAPLGSPLPRFFPFPWFPVPPSPVPRFPAAPCQLPAACWIEIQRGRRAVRRLASLWTGSRSAGDDKFT
jgi:hypothetical protein